MGGPPAPVDGLPPESGRPSGVQYRASGHPGRPEPHRHFGGPHCHHLQLVLCHHGAHRRLGGGPFQPEMGDHHQHPLLERGHHVHGPGHQFYVAGRPALGGYRRRRSLFWPGQLFPAGAVPYRHPRPGHVHPPDRLLCGRHPGGLAGRPHCRQDGLEVLLHHLWCRGHRMGNPDDFQAQGLSQGRRPYSPRLRPSCSPSASAASSSSLPVT